MIAKILQKALERNGFKVELAKYVSRDKISKFSRLDSREYTIAVGIRE